MEQISKGQLRWQCRRGMRELDQLLTRYLETRFDAAGEREKSAFAAFLTLSDPELAAYLLHGVEPESGFADIVEQILGRTDA